MVQHPELVTLPIPSNSSIWWQNHHLILIAKRLWLHQANLFSKEGTTKNKICYASLNNPISNASVPNQTIIYLHQLPPTMVILYTSQKIASNRDTDVYMPQSAHKEIGKLFPPTRTWSTQEENFIRLELTNFASHVNERLTVTSTLSGKVQPRSISRRLTSQTTDIFQHLHLHTSCGGKSQFSGFVPMIPLIYH